jgi:DTW domain-containing protein YfiP
MRILCSKCLKAQDHCYCSELKPFRSRVQIALLQHPLERKKTVGTARMAHLTIENSVLIPGNAFNKNEQVRELIVDPTKHCVVLFPGPHSRNISESPQEEVQSWFPSGKTLVVFVVDGTWACAKRMLVRSSCLLELPQISFTPKRKSEYQFRKQPQEHCLSTIEAVHHILEILDPTVNPEPLLELFRNMVKRQVSYSKMGQIRRTTV